MTTTCSRESMLTTSEETDSALSDEVRFLDCRMYGCTMRLGEYVLITAPAPGSHITWDLYKSELVTHRDVYE